VPQLAMLWRNPFNPGEDLEMRVIILPDRTEKELSGPMRVDSILSELQMNPETVLVLKSGALITPDQKVNDDEKIEIWPVISGGRDDFRDAM